MTIFGRRRALVCQQAVELLTDYLEDALDPADRARLESHLGDCPHCREYLVQLKATIDACDAFEPDALDPTVRDSLVDLYRRWSSP